MQDALDDIEPGAHIDLLVARNNLPVEIERHLRADARHRAAAEAVRAAGRSGRVDLTRAGQRRAGRDARRRRVHAAALAGSVRLRKPVKVVANGRTVFDGRVQKDVRTLRKWAAVDNDRTMLFGAEMHVDLTR